MSRDDKCAFCGKGQDEIKILIAGPKAYICDECIGDCNKILQERVYSGKPAFLQNVPDGLTLVDMLSDLVFDPEISLKNFLELVFKEIDKAVADERIKTIRGMQEAIGDLNEHLCGLEAKSIESAETFSRKIEEAKRGIASLKNQIAEAMLDLPDLVRAMLADGN